MTSEVIDGMTCPWLGRHTPDEDPAMSATDLATPEQYLATMPFAEEIGVRLTDVSAEAVVGELDWAAHRCTLGGVLHGGALMTLADSVGAVSAFLNLPDGAVGTSTIESKTNLVGAVREGMAVATARPVHVGRTTIVVQTEVRVGDRLVALTTQTQSVLSG